MELDDALTRLQDRNQYRGQYRGYGSQLSGVSYADPFGSESKSLSRNPGNIPYVSAGIRKDYSRPWQGTMEFSNPERGEGIGGAIVNAAKAVGQGMQRRNARKQQQYAQLQQQYANMYAGQGNWYGQAYQQGQQQSQQAQSQALQQQMQQGYVAPPNYTQAYTQQAQQAQQAQTAQQASSLAQTMMGGYTGDIDPFGSTYATATQQSSSRAQQQQQQQESQTAQRQQKVLQDVYGGEDYRSVYEASAQEASKRERVRTPVDRPEPAWKASAQERGADTTPPGAPDFSWRDELIEKQQQQQQTEGSPRRRRPAGPNLKEMSRIAQELNNLNK